MLEEKSATFWNLEYTNVLASLKLALSKFMRPVNTTFLNDALLKKVTSSNHAPAEKVAPSNWAGPANTSSSKWASASKVRRVVGLLKTAVANASQNRVSAYSASH